MDEGVSLPEILIIYFNSKKIAAEDHRKLVKVYGESAPSDKWIRRFKSGGVRVEDKKRTPTAGFLGGSKKIWGITGTGISKKSMSKPMIASKTEDSFFKNFISPNQIESANFLALLQLILQLRLFFEHSVKISQLCTQL